MVIGVGPSLDPSQPPLLHPGQAVFGLAEGSLGSHVLASAQTLIPMPATLSFPQASSVPTAFVTIELALEFGAALGPGESLLVHGATGGVGLAALQGARHLGALVIATAGSPEKRALMRRLGAKTVAGSRDLGFVETIVRCERGADVLLNTLTSAGGVIFMSFGN